MSLFKQVLAELKKKIDVKSGNTQQCSEVLQSILHITILPEQIMISRGTLRLQVSPTIKMAVKLKESEILQTLKKHNISIITIQ